MQNKNQCGATFEDEPPNNGWDLDDKADDTQEYHEACHIHRAPYESLCLWYGRGSSRSHKYEVEILI